VTAEKDGHVYFAIVHMTVGTYTANIAFPDYVYPHVLSPTPMPTAAPTAQGTATPTAKPTATPAPGPGLAATALLLAIAGLAAVRKK